VAGLLFLSSPTAFAGEKRLLVFAAASTTNLLTELGAAFQNKTGVKLVNSFASSSTLAKQIKLGAPANVYVSANLKWMDYLEKVGALVPGSRCNLMRNRLVLIAPAESTLGKVKIVKGLDLPALPGDGRLALGDPAHVPAGIYAKEALTSLGFWPQVQAKLAAAANVRAALALVESGEAPLGVVYATDAAISRKVKVLGIFPLESHGPIVYPAALVKEYQSPAGRGYLDFLRSPAATAVFRKYGFLPY
jgi:molybdate transport system substrate-binding protein